MNEGMDRTPLTRDFHEGPRLEVAPAPRGRTLARTSDVGPVEVRLTEVAPSSHAFRDRTARTGVTSAPPGHMYVSSMDGTSRRSA